MIEQTVRIDAPPERVWAYLTDPAKLARWWG
ncbi:SRPBCC family protein, partial [Jiangella anatolica]